MPTEARCSSCLAICCRRSLRAPTGRSLVLREERGEAQFGDRRSWSPSGRAEAEAASLGQPEYRGPTPGDAGPRGIPVSGRRTSGQCTGAWHQGAGSVLILALRSARTGPTCRSISQRSIREEHDFDTAVATLSRTASGEMTTAAPLQGQHQPRHGSATKVLIIDVFIDKDIDADILLDNAENHHLRRVDVRSHKEPHQRHLFLFFCGLGAFHSGC